KDTHTFDGGGLHETGNSGPLPVVVHRLLESSSWVVVPIGERNDPSPLPLSSSLAIVQSYPNHWEADVVLTDGGTAHLRPITPDDADLLREFHSRLSPETIYYRFFAPYPRLS